MPMCLHISHIRCRAWLQVAHMQCFYDAVYDITPKSELQKCIVAFAGNTALPRAKLTLMVGPSAKAKLLGLTSSRSTSEALPLLEGADAYMSNSAWTYLSSSDQASIVQISAGRCFKRLPLWLPYERHKTFLFSVYSALMQFVYNSMPQPGQQRLNQLCDFARSQLTCAYIAIRSHLGCIYLQVDVDTALCR